MALKGLADTKGKKFEQQNDSVVGTRIKVLGNSSGGAVPTILSTTTKTKKSMCQQCEMHTELVHKVEVLIQYNMHIHM